jgi:hypothetical protein
MKKIRCRLFFLRLINLHFSQIGSDSNQKGWFSDSDDVIVTCR